MPALTSAPKTYRVFITVYKGATPPDRHDTRHAGLFFQSQGSNVMYHVVKDQKREDWILDEYNHHDPKLSVGHVELGNVTMVVDELYRLMKSVPLNQDPEPMTSNSQVWVDQALLVLKREGYITEGDYKRAVDEMLGIAMEGEL